MNGILILDKPKGFTSRDCINKLNKILNIKKLGHTGTLDPMATGVLPICINKATKFVQFLESNEKEYECEITIGIETDTEDIEGKILNEDKNVSIDLKQIDKVLISLLGKQKQIPPMYSAVKYKGKELYKYAYNGIHIEDRPVRDIEVKSILRTSGLTLNDGFYKFSFKIVSSKGTYIRTICTEIGKQLNTIACMSGLRRTRSGKFTINNAFTLENISNGNFDVISFNEILDFKKIECDKELFLKIINGSKLPDIYNNEKISFMYQGELIAIYSKYKDNLIKPIKVFRGNNE